ncbi:MAG: peroxiredoxin family protein [Candidatus Eisenbacteria bacterium]
MKTPALVAPFALSLTLALLPAAPGFAQADSKQGPGNQQPTPPPGNSGSPQYESRISGEAAVGERAPDFELDGSQGKPVRLSSYRGQWVVLAFGDRKETVAPMAEVAASLESAGIRLLGVCNEKSYFLGSYARQKRFPFPLLADVTREISDMYGLYDSRERFVLPGFIMIDPRGTVRFALLGHSLPAEDVARLARYVSARP